MSPSALQNHVILCGLGQVGWLVLDYLRQIGWPVVAVDTKCEPGDARLGGAPLVRGDCRLKATLEAAGIAQAKAVLVLTSEDLVNLTCALTASGLRPDLRIVARFFNQSLIGRLGTALPNLRPVSKSGLTATLFAMTALSGETLAAFELPHGRKEVVDLRLGPGSPLLGRKLAAVGKEGDVAVLAHERTGGAKEAKAASSAACLLEVDLEATLQEGDRLAVCGGAEEVGKIAALAQDESESELLWASLVRRLSRVAWRTLSEVETPVKVVVGVFASVVLIASLVFWLVRPGSFAHAAMRVVGVIGTAGDLHSEQEPDGIKIFIAFLRIVGIVLTASLTALITNYLVRAKLGGALAASKIPDRGHIVVCGLGNIGIRVVEELRRRKAPVVVIEKTPQGRFLSEARRLRAAVILGDACFKDVLAKAHAARAKAVVAATNDDLVNVEIALLARDLNPKQRVVVRLDDPTLAAALKTAAPIRHALAVPALAAPAIVAALYRDRILCLFTCRSQLMAMVEVTLDEDSAPRWAGQAVREAAIDFRFVPVDLVSEGQPAPLAEIPNRRLRPGDRLTVATAMGDLDRFLRHEPPPRNWIVEVAHCPPPMREWLAQLYRTLNEAHGGGADAALAANPIRLKSGLTRGQAEGLLWQLRRERIVGAARQEPPCPDAPADSPPA